ncbi:hypothetical protein BDZ89DRAFT_945760 [Hymenopellis radicata]|nr:hypothetical protein BDZ89DRAFT_945760 [Hymenopellis radicata]
MSRTNGKPEVIVNYQDGFSYSKGKMETALLPGGLLDKPPVKATKDPHAASIKKEDIDVIVNEFELSRPQAEKVLLQHGGDLLVALKALINP